MGFEPTEACTSSDFKSDAIDQLCHLSYALILSEKGMNVKRVTTYIYSMFFILGQEGIRTPDTVVRSHVL